MNKNRCVLIDNRRFCRSCKSCFVPSEKTRLFDGCCKQSCMNKVGAYRTTNTNNVTPTRYEFLELAVTELDNVLHFDVLEIL